jgi:hypothetical protein
VATPQLKAAVSKLFASDMNARFAITYARTIDDLVPASWPFWSDIPLESFHGDSK